MDLNYEELFKAIIGNVISSKLSFEEQKRNFVELLKRKITLDGRNELPGVIAFYRKELQDHGKFPSFELVLHHFRHFEGFFGKVKNYEPLTFIEYTKVLEQYGNEISKKDFQKVITEASMLCNEGVDTAVQHLLSNVSVADRDIISADTFDFKTHYKKASESSYGPMFFMKVFDEYIRLPLGKMMTMFAFVGHLKTTLALNFTYNSAIRLGYNFAFVSLEMAREEILYRLYLRHSVDPKFNNIRVPVSWTNIYKKDLNDEQVDFLDEVRKDFGSSSYGKIHVIDSADFDTINQVELENMLLYLDLISPDGLDAWVLDYIQLLSNLADSNQDDSERRIISRWARWAQQISKRFRSKREGDLGISTVLLAQSRRKGYTDARDRGGSYLLTDISDSSELEKASDYVVSIFYGEDEREKKLAKVQLIKNKDGLIHSDVEEVFVDLDHLYMGDAQSDTLSEAEIDTILTGRS